MVKFPRPFRAVRKQVKGLKQAGFAVGVTHVNNAYDKAINKVVLLKAQLDAHQSVHHKNFVAVEKFYWQERKYFPSEFNDRMRDFFSATDDGIFLDDSVNILADYLKVLEDTKLVLVGRIAKHLG